MKRRSATSAQTKAVSRPGASFSLRRRQPSVESSSSRGSGPGRGSRPSSPSLHERAGRGPGLRSPRALVDEELPRLGDRSVEIGKQKSDGKGVGASGAFDGKRRVVDREATFPDLAEHDGVKPSRQASGVVARARAPGMAPSSSAHVSATWSSPRTAMLRSSRVSARYHRANRGRSRHKVGALAAGRSPTADHQEPSMSESTILFEKPTPAGIAVVTLNTSPRSRSISPDGHRSSTARRSGRSNRTRRPRSASSCYAAHCRPRRPALREARARRERDHGATGVGEEQGFHTNKIDDRAQAVDRRHRREICTTGGARARDRLRFPTRRPTVADLRLAR